MINESRLAASGTINKATTKWREWLGWFGVMFWFYSMINGYQYLPNSYDSAYFLKQDIDYIWWFVIAFLAVGVISITAIGFRFGRDPNRLGKLAFYTTPAAVAFTAAFPFLPPPWGSILYALSPAFIAPALIRRAYGVARTARPGYIFTTYMSGIAVAFAIMNPFLDYCCDYETPVKIVYAVYAAFAFLAWLGIRRSIADTRNASGTAGRGLSKSLMLVIAAAGLLLFWFIKLSGLINYTVEQFDDILYVPVYYVLPPLSYVLFGFIGDKGRERAGVIGALALFLISVQLAFLADDPLNPAVIPLVVTNHFFCVYVEYFILTIPLCFFKQVKRPALAAALGVASYLLCWFFTRVTHPMIPSALMRSGAPLFVSTAITAIALLLLLNIIFQRHREHTLAAALHAMIRAGRPSLIKETSPAGEAGMEGEPEQAKPINELLTSEEVDVAMLLIDGETRYSISRKLHRPVSDINKQMDAIRAKVIRKADPNPGIAAAVIEFSLTRREADTLHCLNRGMTNAKIAEELDITEDTVKKHVRSLMRKIPVDDRKDVPNWVCSLGGKTE